MDGYVWSGEICLKYHGIALTGTVISKAIRKLRHPTRSHPIRYGLEKTKELKQQEICEKKITNRDSTKRHY